MSPTDDDPHDGPGDDHAADAPAPDAAPADRPADRPRERPRVISPLDAMADGESGPFPFDLFERSALAQGDSWFSMGAIPPTRTTRVLAELKLARSTVIVNCARPGALLHRMTETSTESNFLNLLGGRRARRFDVILLSGGGNDMIEAAGAPPTAPAARRLLRTRAEHDAGTESGGDAWISAPGWQTFAAHIGQVFHRLVDRRDASRPNAHTPIVWHNYAPVQPTDVGAGAGFGPWLRPAMQAAGIPRAQERAVADALLARLRTLVDELVAARLAADPGAALFVADSQSAGLVAADPDATDESGDWTNEIHPSRGGYGKAARAWEAVLDPLLG